VVVVGRGEGPRWDDHKRLAVLDQLAAPLGEQLLEPAMSALRVRTPVAGDVDGAGADLVGQCRGGVSMSQIQQFVDVDVLISKMTPPVRTGFSRSQNTNTGRFKLLPMSVSPPERLSLRRGISRGD
jgi:hypothetical protein